MGESRLELQDIAEGLGNADLPVVALLTLIGQGDQAPVCGFSGEAGLPLHFHGGELGGLIAGDLLAAEVTDIDLERRNGDRSGQDNFERFGKKGRMAIV